MQFAAYPCHALHAQRSRRVLFQPREIAFIFGASLRRCFPGLRAHFFLLEREFSEREVLMLRIVFAKALSQLVVRVTPLSLARLRFVVRRLSCCRWSLCYRPAGNPVPPSPIPTITALGDPFLEIYASAFQWYDPFLLSAISC